MTYPVPPSRGTGVFCARGSASFDAGPLPRSPAISNDTLPLLPDEFGFSVELIVFGIRPSCLKAILRDSYSHLPVGGAGGARQSFA